MTLKSIKYLLISDYLSDKEVSLFLETIEVETKEETDAALSKIESFEDLLSYFDLTSGESLTV